MYCSKCGKENNDNNIYCNYCGTKLQLDTNKLSSDRFVIENNTTVDIALLIASIISYIIVIKMFGPMVLDSSLLIIDLLTLVIIVLLTAVVIWIIYYVVQKSKAGKYSLIIDKNGITDYYSAATIGFIPWSDIQDIYVENKGTVKYIEIKLKDEEKYLTKVSIIPRSVMLLSKKLRHEMIKINPPKDMFENVLQEISKIRNSSAQ